MPISVIESVQNYTEAGKTVQPCRTYVGQQSGVSRKLKINEAPVSVDRTQLNLDWVADFKILDCAIKLSFHRRSRHPHPGSFIRCSGDDCGELLSNVSIAGVTFSVR